MKARVREFLGRSVDACSRRLEALARFEAIADRLTALLEALAGFEVIGTEANLVLDAHQLAQREQLSGFDALIAEAALPSGCRLLFSEEICHGLRTPQPCAHSTWSP